MILVPPIPFLRRRRRRAGTGGAPTPPPAPLNLTAIEDLVFGGDVLNFVVVFDTNEDVPLADPVGADPAKWTARYAGASFVATSLIMVDFQRIQVGMELGGPPLGPGANVLNYANAPSDIADEAGRQLAACVDMPL